MDDKEILLNIKVNAEQAMANIVSLTRQNEELKKGLQDLNKIEKENGKLTDEQIKTKIDLSAQIKENNAGIRENAKELKVQQSEVAKSEGSINAMRSRLRELTSAYNSMSKEMRESEVGKRVAGEMKVLNESVNTANLNVSNFKDNIGNYPQVVQSFLGGNSAIVSSMQNLGITATTTAEAFGKNMVMALKAVGMQMKMLMANPLIAGLAGILVVIMAIVEAIKRSDTAMTAIQRAFAPIQDFLDYVFKAVGFIAEGIAKAVEWVMTLGGNVETARQKALRLEDELEDKRRENRRLEAKENQALAEAQEKVRDAESFSVEERKKALLEAKKLQDEQYKRRVQIAKLELEQYKLQNKNNNRTDEYKDKEADMEAKINDLLAEKAQTNRSILRDMNRLNNEIEKQAESERKAQAERVKIWKETQIQRLKIEQSLLKDLEDLTLAMMKEGQEKEIAQVKLTGERKIKELKDQLATEQNLTAKARNTLNELIRKSEEKLQNDILAIVDKYADLQEEAERVSQEKINAEKTAKELQQQADAQALKLEQRRLELANELAFELEQEQIKNDALKALKNANEKQLLEAGFATQEAYELAVLQSNERLKKSNQAVIDSQKNQQIQMLASMGQIVGAMSQLFGSIAGDSKALQGFQKALAFAEIMANMAIGISKAISKTGGEPFSTTALITTVVTGITSAIGILKKTETPPVPSQLNAGGGTGSGATPTVSIPSINVPTAMANPTLALQASRQSEMQLNNTDNVMQAVSSMPAPQVEVKEITQGINNVQVKESRSKF